MTLPERSARGRQVRAVTDAWGKRLFARAGGSPYRNDPNWVPPFPGEERATFDPRQNPSLVGVTTARWVLMERGVPIGRIAAFAPRHRPGTGYVGFFESAGNPEGAGMLLDVSTRWLAAQGCTSAFGPIAVTPRDRIGMLTEGFDHPPLLFTPYNPPHYPALFEEAGWTPHRQLRAYGWRPGTAGHQRIHALVNRSSRGSGPLIRPIRMDRLEEDTRAMAQLLNATLSTAWHFDPLGDLEAGALARLLRPILDPSLALFAEDHEGICGAILGVPDANWLWHRAGGRLLPFGWARLWRWRRHIPQVRLMALGLAPRVRGTALALRLIDAVDQAGVARGCRHGEMSQVYDDNQPMCSMLDAMEFPVVRRYTVFTCDLKGVPA